MTAPASTAPHVWDGVLVAALLIVGLGRLLATSAGDGWTVSSALRISALLALPWRRRYPVTMIGFGFGMSGLGALGQVASRGFAEPPDVTAGLLLLPHALGRWSSRTRVAVGVGVAAGLMTISLVAEALTPAEMAGAAVFLSIPLAIGISSRLQGRIRGQALVQAQLNERHRLGRELDHAVAHRLVAIIDRTHGPYDQTTAVEALSEIEEQASQCLIERARSAPPPRRGRACAPHQPNQTANRKMGRAVAGGCRRKEEP